MVLIFLAALVELVDFGHAQKDSVLQFPVEMTIQVGHSTAVHCNFSTGDSNPYIYWYQQRHIQPPQMLLWGSSAEPAEMQGIIYALLEDKGEFLICALVTAGRVQVRQDLSADITKGIGISINCSHLDVQGTVNIQWNRQLSDQAPHHILTSFMGNKPVPNLTVTLDRAQVQQKPSAETTEGIGISINCSHPKIDADFTHWLSLRTKAGVSQAAWMDEDVVPLAEEEYWKDVDLSEEFWMQ
ncbi:hypothetical protein Q9233_012308 [Columba guinea]|nr:hypothetical protein Q9233_012308 [Columba guinea]